MPSNRRPQRPIECQNNNCCSHSPRLYPVKIKGGGSSNWCGDCITRDRKYLKEVIIVKSQRKKKGKTHLGKKTFFANTLHELEADFEEVLPYD